MSRLVEPLVRHGNGKRLESRGRFAGNGGKDTRIDSAAEISADRHIRHETVIDRAAQQAIDFGQRRPLVADRPFRARRCPPGRHPRYAPASRIEAQNRAGFELTNVAKERSRRLDCAVEIVFEHGVLVGLAGTQLHQRLQRRGERKHVLGIDVVQLLDPDTISGQQEFGLEAVVVA